jgi:hypothetical protein
VRQRILGVLATAAAFAGVTGAAATPAAAAGDWITSAQVHTITNPQTAVSKSTPSGILQIRFGTYEGRQYGWGRVLETPGGSMVRFEYDTDGNRVPNGSFTSNNPPGTKWSAGYRTSSSSAYAFRACIIFKKGIPCSQVDSSRKTGWW